MPAKQSAADFRVPAAMVSALNLTSAYGFDYESQVRTLSKAKHEGMLSSIPVLAEKALGALAPVEGRALTDRLTMLGMSTTASAMDGAQMRAWLHETGRLLSDLPQSVLFDAIDECVREPGRVFLPTVGEIRAKAADDLKQRERIAARLNALARLMAEGIEIPDWIAPQWVNPAPAFREEDRCSPDEAAAILAEFGLKGSFAEGLADNLKPDQAKSRADIIAAGHEPPPIRESRPDPWEMMA